VDLTVGPGERVAVAGRNGAGKSTLIALLAGVAEPARGTAFFRGAAWETVHRPFRQVSVIYQNPEDTFVSPVLEEDVAFGAENAGLEGQALRRAVDGALAAVGLAGMATRHPGTLSGGQQQLAALAGALVRSPEAVLLDEATSFLDAATRRRFTTLLEELRRREGLTIVAATQEPEEMWESDRLVLLDQGRVAYDGPPAGLLASPPLCRRHGLPQDPLAVLASLLTEGRDDGQRGRPTVDALERWILDRIP
jgi:energy-coupling factor transport system ATP-binding protein